MEIMNKYDFSLLRNDAERFMIDELDKQLKEVEDMCKCEECILDIATFALNKIKPRYHVSLLGQLYSKSTGDKKYMDEVKKAVKSAIEKVKNNPSHD
jgi:competence protein ComFB